MPRFSANLSTLYPEHPFLDRFAAARTDGFLAVECQFPYDVPAERIATCLRQHGLTQVLINAPPGNLAAGDRGIAALPGREREFATSAELAISYALTLGCKQVNVLAGIAGAGMDKRQMRATYVENLKTASARFAEHGLDLLIEPINARDFPNYFLNTQADAHTFVEEVGAPNLRMQMDFYHTQIVEGDITTKFQRYQRYISHVQIAGVPGRNEPDTGELNYPYLFELLDRLGFAGWVGCEYRPSRTGPGGTSAGLGWFSRYRE